MRRNETSFPVPNSPPAPCLPAPHVVSRPAKRLNCVAITPLLIGKSLPGCVCGVGETTHTPVPAPTTPPATADGCQCGPLVIDPCLSLSFRVNDSRQVEPDPLRHMRDPLRHMRTLSAHGKWRRG